MWHGREIKKDTKLSIATIDLHWTYNKRTDAHMNVSVSVLNGFDDWAIEGIHWHT